MSTRLNSISDITSRLISMQDADLSDEIASFHNISVLVHELCVEIRRLELLGIARNEIIDELHEAREIHGRSVFISRLQNWPRGYQGDFETIEYLCNGINFTPIDTVEFYLENIALSSPLAQQHENKVFWQSKYILSAIYESQNNEGILSIGSGGCRDLRLIEPSLNNNEVRLIINDIDKDAIDYSKQCLESIWHKIIPLHGDSLRKTKRMSKHAPFCLIVAGGLFDYLPDRYACTLLKKLSAMLTKNGKICFTNIIMPNPWRVWVDYLADWSLIERTEQEFQKMFNVYNLHDLKLKMVRDRTSLVGLYEITKASTITTHCGF